MKELKNGVGIILLAAITACARTAPSPRLIKYLKAERELRQRVQSEPLKTDSIKVLQRQYHVDPGRELARLGGNPERWGTLLKELKGGK
jgi:hypothetical protein